MASQATNATSSPPPPPPSPVPVLALPAIDETFGAVLLGTFVGLMYVSPTLKSHEERRAADKAFTIINA